MSITTGADRDHPPHGRVEVVIEARDLRCYDPDQRRWLLDPGKLTFEVAASSRDIRAETTVEVEGATLPLSILNVESQPFMVLDQEFARKRFGEDSALIALAFARRFGLTTAELLRPHSPRQLLAALRQS